MVQTSILVLWGAPTVCGRIGAVHQAGATLSVFHGYSASYPRIKRAGEDDAAWYMDGGACLTADTVVTKGGQ